MSVPAIQTLPTGYEGPLCWPEIQCALDDWITAVLVLDPGKVIWAKNTTAIPEYPYVSLDIISGPTPEGSYDDLRYQGLDVGLGTERLEQRLQGSRLMTLSIVVHNQYGKDSTGAVGLGGTALALAAKLQGSLSDKNFTEGLYETGGLSMVSRESLVDTSFVINGDWVSRATLDVIFRATYLSVSEVEFIERVEIEATHEVDGAPDIVTNIVADITA